MSHQITVRKATIILKGGTDHVILELDLPRPIWPFEGYATATLETPCGYGEAFVREHLPAVEVEVIGVWRRT